MKNPFTYGGVVEKEAFCNRSQEITDLMRAMENGERLFVYSERRVGKTSLVQRALDRLPKRNYLSAYIDLWPTDGEATFAAAMAQAITEKLASSSDKMLSMAKTFFGRLSPTLTVNDKGETRITFALRPATKIGSELEEVLEAPARIAEQRKVQVVIVFDEFQRIMEYGNDRVERQLRSTIQHQSNVSYIFLGSRKHLIQKMFLDQSRPLYRSGGHYPLGMIATRHWLSFIRKRFNPFERAINDDQIRAICALTQGHPFYTQHVCHVVWELCGKGESVSDEMIERAINILLDRESYAYTALWESFSLNQRRLLKGLAAMSGETKVFSADFVRTTGLRSASNVQRSAETLLERDIIDRDEGSFIIVDRFFRQWIGRARLV